MGMSYCPTVHGASWPSKLSSQLGLRICTRMTRYLNRIHPPSLVVTRRYTAPTMGFPDRHLPRVSFDAHQPLCNRFV